MCVVNVCIGVLADMTDMKHVVKDLCQETNCGEVGSRCHVTEYLHFDWCIEVM